MHGFGSSCSMNSETMVIQASNISKSFRHYPTGRARLFHALGLGMPVVHSVLEDVSFSVKRGESIGIIGVNGAGKSTLLKILVGTLLPTSGKVRRNGRVGAILELGLGFHPQFSGRENARYAARLMGYDKAEVERKLPEILDFSELGSAVEDPVRTYSTGMQMRLAFSAATAFSPDLLVIDEALAVGDAYFQHKSFERIRQLHQAGTALLIVSHDAQAIQTLCSRALLLDGGQLAMDDTPDRVLDEYNARIARREEASTAANGPAPGRERRHGSGLARIAQVSFQDVDGHLLTQGRTGQTVQFEIGYEVLGAVQDLAAGIAIRDRTGYVVFGTNTHHMAVPLPNARGRYALTLHVPRLALGPGSYSVSVALHKGRTHVEDDYDWIDRAAIFQVINVDEPWFNGVCHIPMNAEVRPVDEPK
jgi:lipopolysaccharide transport system ATP-binding protein